MLTVVRLVMLFCAVMIGACIGLGLHALMPQVSILLALFYFFVLGLAFLFGCTLVIASLMIGSAPGRSKLGQELADKVESQQTGARGVHEQKRAETRCRQTGATETTMRPPQTK